MFDYNKSKLIVTLAALSTLVSCQSVKQVAANVYDGAASVVEGAADSLPGINRLSSNISESYDERLKKRIVSLEDELEDAKYEDVENNRDLFVGVMKEMAEFILKKAQGDPENNVAGENIEYIIPAMEKEFMRTDAAKKFGGRKKNAVRVLLESFKIMSTYFSDDASRAFFEKLSKDSALCKNFIILRDKDDSLTCKKAMRKNAEMIGFKMDISEEILLKEKELDVALKGQRVLNFIRNKENG